MLNGLIGSAIFFIRRVGRKIDSNSSVARENSTQLKQVNQKVDELGKNIEACVREIGPLKERVAVLEYAMRMARRKRPVEQGESR